MSRWPSRFHPAWVPLLLAAFVAACGGIDDKPPAHRQDAAVGDIVSPRMDGPAVLPDLPPATPDTAPTLDTGTATVDSTVVESDAGVVEAGCPEAGGEAGLPGLDGGAGPETSPPVTVVVMPDTQYYAASYPEVFRQQTKWILDQKPALNIAAVLHVGDVVDAGGSKDQWALASSAMRKLDGIVPYVLVPGNHDMDSNRQGLMSATFGPASMPWITGTMTEGQIENNFALIDIGGRQWLVVGIEFGPRDAVVAWADKVLKAYPDRPAIIVTHAYLYNDGNRYDIAISGSDTSKDNYQWWIPQYYGFTPSEGINDGEMLWRKLVLPNPNVRLVFSGHVTGAARLTSTRPDGSRVHQMLSDYQWLDAPPDFGYGYLRVVQLDYGKKTIQVQTYSPYLQQYLTDDANQFTLDLYL
jgi:hypothetical protein